MHYIINFNRLCVKKKTSYRIIPQLWLIPMGGLVDQMFKQNQN